MLEAIVSITVLGLVLTLVILSSVSQLQKRVAVLTRLEAKLDLLLSNAGIQHDSLASVIPAVADALRRGQKIEAIKHYRDATGVGLKEAKDFVDEAERRAGLGG